MWVEAGGWRHRLWRRKPDGTVNDVIPVRDGFPSDYGLIRDQAGNTYWADRSEKTVIKKRSAVGKVTTHASGDFRMVQWMVAAPDGTLFLMDGPDLRRVTPDGNVTTVAAKISEHRPAPAAVSDRNYHQGLWIDRERNAYIAVSRERIVLRVTPDGRSSVAARSPESWSPSGGMFDRQGRMWLLEYNSANVVRIRRVDRGGRGPSFTGAAP